MAVGPVTVTLRTAAAAPVAWHPARSGDLQVKAGARAEADAAAGVEQAGGGDRHVPAVVAGGDLGVPPGHVVDGVGAAGRVEHRHLAAGAHLDHHQVGHGLVGSEVQVGGQRPGTARGEDRHVAGGGGLGDGDVHGHRRHARGRHPAPTGDLHVDGGARPDRPGQAARPVAGVEDALGRQGRVAPGTGRRDHRHLARIGATGGDRDVVGVTAVHGLPPVGARRRRGEGSGGGRGRRAAGQGGRAADEDDVPAAPDGTGLEQHEAHGPGGRRKRAGARDGDDVLGRPAEHHRRGAEEVSVGTAFVTSDVSPGVLQGPVTGP